MAALPVFVSMRAVVEAGAHVAHVRRGEIWGLVEGPARDLAHWARDEESIGAQGYQGRCGVGPVFVNGEGFGGLRFLGDGVLPGKPTAVGVLALKMARRVAGAECGGGVRRWMDEAWRLQEERLAAGLARAEGLGLAWTMVGKADLSGKGKHDPAWEEMGRMEEALLEMAVHLQRIEEADELARHVGGARAAGERRRL